MNLIEVRNVEKGTLPFTNNTIYKLHSQARYPNVIFKVCGKTYLIKELAGIMWRKRRVCFWLNTRLYTCRQNLPDEYMGPFGCARRQYGGFGG